jgi:glycogen operon protein
VTYEHKRNEANGEGNRDGEQHNRPIRCGHEGETDDPGVNALRAQQQRNVLATLLLSAGVPMITAGDEHGRSQLGNNNAYCQDNPLSWLDWSRIDSGLLEFVRRMLALRRQLGSTFERSRAFRCDGLAARDEDFGNPALRTLALWLVTTAERGLLLILNTGPFDQRCSLPAAAPSGRYRHVMDTHEPSRERPRDVLAAGTPVRVAAHSLRLFEEAP